MMNRPAFLIAAVVLVLTLAWYAMPLPDVNAPAAPPAATAPATQPATAPVPAPVTTPAPAEAPKQ